MPVIRQISCTGMFIFQQDPAPAHRVRKTIELLAQETPGFILLDQWRHPTVLILTQTCIDYKLITILGYNATALLPDEDS